MVYTVGVWRYATVYVVIETGASGVLARLFAVANANLRTGGSMMEEWLTMTPQERLNEPGTEPDCPYCARPRVTRSTYIRCNPCGKNWMQGSDIFKHPHTKPTKPSQPETGDTVQPAKTTTEVVES